MASKKRVEKTVVVPKTTADLQRIKLEKLMKDPTKEIIIPDRPKDWKPKGPQEFIRNVWGSSAGAGSGDFHVYRGIRRREYARQKFNNEKTAKETEDDLYQTKVTENKKTAEERTAKKRAKRLKKNQKMKEKKKQKVSAVDKSEKKADEESDESEAEEDSDGEDKNAVIDHDLTPTPGDQTSDNSARQSSNGEDVRRQSEEDR